MHMCMCAHDVHAHVHVHVSSYIVSSSDEKAVKQLAGFEMAVDINPLCCPPMRSHTDTHIYIAWSTLPYGGTI